MMRRCVLNPIPAPARNRLKHRNVWSDSATANDEIRMSNDEGSPKPKSGRGDLCVSSVRIRIGEHTRLACGSLRLATTNSWLLVTLGRKSAKVERLRSEPDWH